MIYKIPTNRQQQIIIIKIKVDKPCRVGVTLMDADPDLPNTILFDRVADVKSIFIFKIRLPLCGEESLLQIYNANTGDDKYINIEAIDFSELEKFLEVADMKNRIWQFAVEFFENFAFKASILKPAIYQSKKYYYYQQDNYGNTVKKESTFQIDYVSQIISEDTGLPLNTCARTDKHSGRIEVSRAKFVNMTVPGRIAILLHEYSHFFENTDINNEYEADINATFIYLALGYPRIEIHNVFLDLFIGAVAQTNLRTDMRAEEKYNYLNELKQRYDLINKIITDFDEKRSVLYQY